MTSRRMAFSILAIALLLCAGTAAGQEAPQPALKARHADPRTPRPPGDLRPLTEPTRGEPLDIALGYLRPHSGELGFTPDDLTDVIVTSQHISDHTGVTHIYLGQRYNGIEVHGADISISVTKDGRVLSAASSFLRDLEKSVHTESPARGAVESAEAAAAHLGVRLRDPIEVMYGSDRPDRNMMLSDGGISRRPISAKLVYEPLDSGQLALAWLVEIDQTDADHWWSLSIDAASGEVLDRVDYTTHDVWVPADAASRPASAAAPAIEHAMPGSAHSAESVPAGAGGVPDSGTFRVYAWPGADPNDGDRVLETNPASPAASPFGWNDTNGLPGAESTLTTGNNVDAYTDINNNNNGNTPDIRADGGPGLVFDFPANLADGPDKYRPAVVTNLFYWNNLMHDISYQYGFTESAGNFQLNNYGKFDAGGNDRVLAEAQDGGGTNNANFSTPVDGSSGRMQMFLWFPAGGFQVQLASGTNFAAVRANFGAFLSDPLVKPPAGEVHTVGTACTAAMFTGFVPGQVAFAGTASTACSNVVKAVNAQAAGAVGIIINGGANPATLTGITPVNASGQPTLTIPVLAISAASATELQAALPSTATMAFLGTQAPLRDGDFDATVVAHEYTHGISTRLTGGRLNSSCLNNNEQMGEGWSDWIALAFTHDPTRSVQRTRGLGPYIRFTGVDGAGIRPTRYSTDLAIDPTTYEDVKTLAVPHGVGYAWASMLWEVYWNLIDKHGFNANVYDPWYTGGNNLAIQLVIDGMKLQPCRPGFVSGRDAILQADQVLTGGANQCAIWKGFAKRGLGFSASQGSSASVTDGVEAFDLPATCLAGATVAPASLSTTLECRASAAIPLTVHNTSAPDGTDLNWSIAAAATDCAAPAGVSWVSASPTSGGTRPGGDAPVTITFDASGLDVGSFSAKACVASNAPSSLSEVPLSMTVVDTTAPTIAPPAPITLAADPAICGTLITDAVLGVASAADNCAAGASVTRSGVPAGNVFPVGTTTIAYAATDAVGLTATANQTVTVADKTPPVIANAWVSPSVLWPPNNKLVDVTIGYSSKDNCGPVTYSLMVASNAAENVIGGVDTSDWQVVDAHHVRLRAERSGSGSGRTYTITIIATDAFGNASTSAVTVRVPHDSR